jgi:hypothetical protein
MSDALTAIRTLYFGTSRATIDKDFDEAIDLLKAMGSEDERDRAAVYMDGLAQMRAQWAPSPSQASAAPQSAAPRGRSGQSRFAGRHSR